jgi:hypothetical protein
MALSDIVNLTITKASAQLLRASFGIPLIASFHTKWVDRVRTYKASAMLSTLVTEGFATTDPTYLAAAALLSNTPKPSVVKIGRRDTTWTQTVEIVPAVASSTVYNGTVDGLAWTFTSDSSATLAEICTGIAAAITALAGVTADGTSATKVVVTGDAAATLHDFAFGSGAGSYSFSDQTVGTGIAADLAVLRGVDKKFYGLVLDAKGEPAIKAAAGWAETDRVIFASDSADSLQLDPASTTDLAYDLKVLGYARTAHFYHPNYTTFMGAAIMGNVFPDDPGSATWKFKFSSGAGGYTISDNAKDALAAKNTNYYDEIAGSFITTEGVTPSGEFVDITQGIDWLHSTMGEDVFAAVKAQRKLPMEDSSGDIIRSAMEGVGARAQDRKILALDPPFVVDIPLIASLSEVDRAARLFSGITFSGRMAGGIHKLDIAGTLSV